MCRRSPPPHVSRRSSLACLRPDRSQSSYPCSLSRGPKLPSCSFQVCASALFLLCREIPSALRSPASLSILSWTLELLPISMKILPDSPNWAGDPGVKKPPSVFHSSAQEKLLRVGRPPLTEDIESAEWNGAPRPESIRGESR